MTDLLDWTYPTTAIPEQGLEVRRVATPEQMNAVATAAGLVGLERLEARFKMVNARRGRFRLSGNLHARVVQACVVTLDPVTADMVEAFSVEFWPVADIPETPAETAVRDLEALGEDPPEPLTHNVIDAGRIVYETLAAALDPYPRMPGATLELSTDAPSKDDEDGAANGAPKSGNPFAALAKLKRPEH